MNKTIYTIAYLYVISVHELIANVWVYCFFSLDKARERRKQQKKEESESIR